jgi:two-component sensor histidine kinase
LANACKHAFPDQRSGKIDVQFLTDEKDAFLSVRDNGVGPGLEFDASQGAGLKTLHTLAEELLHGQVSLKGLEEGGLLFELHFPIKSIDS